MVFKACLGFLITSCIGQLQWNWYLQARPLQDVVLFYEAAHGFLGSMQWLYVHRLQQPLTALGALTTLLALAIDPFTQQLIRAADCSETLSKNIPVSVPRTNFLELPDFDRQMNLKSTIIASLYAFPNLTDFDCPTGNCTFQDTYSSLSFCSRCTDRSSEIVVDEQCSVASGRLDFPDVTYYTEPGPCNAPLDELYSGGQATCVWNLTTSWPPYHHNFYYQIQNDSGASQAPNVFSINNSIQHADGENPFHDYRFAMTLGYSDSAIFRLDPALYNDALSGCDDPATNETWRCRGYGAAMCLLQPCIRTYSCSIEAGLVKETIVEESNLDQTWGLSEPGVVIDYEGIPTFFFSSLLDLQCITDSDRGNLIQVGYDVDTAGRWLPYNVTWNLTATPVNASSHFPESLLANDCLYIMDNLLLDTIGLELLAPILVGHVTRSYIFPIVGVSFDGKQEALSLYNSGNVSMASIDQFFANIAQAMTLWFRSNGDARFGRRAKGDVLHYAVCMRVTWAWIALPAALTGLALVMLALTVATTARRSVPMWKLFPLAVLLRGPAGDDWLDRDLLASNTSKVGKTSSWDDSVDGMSGLASRVSVQLHEQDGEFRLRQVGVQSKKVSRCGSS